ncbi:MAG: hypothetical protein PHY12_09070 [Eubacteriales bacterium]|nr:hypothetical protein [Eubacteriales bacterium]
MKAMKRLLVCLLALCLLCGSSAALAAKKKEPQPIPERYAAIGEDWNATTAEELHLNILAYQKNNSPEEPPASFTPTYRPCSIRFGGTTKELIEDKKNWDLAIVSSKDVNLQRLADEGLIMQRGYNPSNRFALHQWLLPAGLQALLPQDPLMQAYYAGEKLSFDTPEFIALLERTRDVGLRLYKTEPHTKKRQKMLPLFQNGVIMYSFNDGLEWGLSRTVPFRITADQPKLMRANVCMSVIRADSPWRDELMASFEDLLSHYTLGDGRNTDLYVDTQPGPYGVYADSDETAVVTAGYLADWLAYDGAICLAPSRAFYLYEGKLLKFMKGELSAQKLAAIISVPKTNPNK